MSRKLFAFLLSELGTVRLICRREACGAVTEVSVANLGVRFANRTPACPVCNHDLLTTDSPRENALVRLADAITELKKADKTVGVEFILPGE